MSLLKSLVFEVLLVRDENSRAYSMQVANDTYLMDPKLE
jgi:hypothetical protein